MERLLADATKLTGVKYDINSLSDVYTAINAIQQEIGITGTTALEAAETFSGSFSAMKAAAQNALGALTTGLNLNGAFASLGETVSTFLFGNLLPMVGSFIVNLPSGLSSFFSSAIPQFQEKGAELMRSIGAGFSQAFPELSANLKPLVDGIMTAFSQVPVLFQTISSALTSIIEIIASGISRLDFSGFATLANSIIPALTNGFSTFMAIVSPAIDLVVNAFVNLWNAIQPVLSILADALMPVFQVVASFLGGIIAGVLEKVSGIFNILTGVVKALTPVVEFLVDVFKGIAPVLSTVAEWVGKVIGFFGNLGASGGSLSDLLKSAWNNIKTAVQLAKDGINTAINAIKNFFSGLKSAGELLSGGLSSVWNAIKGAVSTASSGIKSSIDGVKNFFANLQTSGDSLKTGLSNAWNAIKTAVSHAGDGIRGVVDRVKGAFDSLKNINLFAAGKAILDGFLRGLKSVWGSITGFVGGIGTWIRNNKGPLSYDRKLLIPAGEAIMSGLRSGMADGFGKVKSDVSEIAGEIANELSDKTTSIANAMDDVTKLTSRSFESDIALAATAQTRLQSFGSIESAGSKSDRIIALLEMLLRKSADVYIDRDTLVGTILDDVDQGLADKQNVTGLAYGGV